MDKYDRIIDNYNKGHTDLSIEGFLNLSSHEQGIFVDSVARLSDKRLALSIYRTLLLETLNLKTT